MKSKVVRISDRLDQEIRNFSAKNNRGYKDASEEIAKLLNKFKNRRIIQEIRF